MVTQTDWPGQGLHSVSIEEAGGEEDGWKAPKASHHKYHKADSLKSPQLYFPEAPGKNTLRPIVIIARVGWVVGSSVSPVCVVGVRCEMLGHPVTAQVCQPVPLVGPAPHRHQSMLQSGLADGRVVQQLSLGIILILLQTYGSITNTNTPVLQHAGINFTNLLKL